jgi:hypothetical protein
MVPRMAAPKPEEDDLAIPSFLDRRKPEQKRDPSAATQKLVERKPPPLRHSKEPMAIVGPVAPTGAVHRSISVPQN